MKKHSSVSGALSKPTTRDRACTERHFKIKNSGKQYKKNYDSTKTLPGTLIKHLHCSITFTCAEVAFTNLCESKNSG
jgi:hypothetical protein